ncbi:nucleotidyltransferase domain-containing protein [Clostridium sp.]|uniref:nucleotidyltransferase domain-containing protein n=1 Tax=Clostridium sp. TaxID=1506 RepID=UPI003D6D1B8B
MNKTQKTIIFLLSSSIRETKVENLNTDNINWLDVFEEAEAHNVTPLIFPTLKALHQYATIDEELISKWKRASLLCGINQIMHIKQMSKVFENFREANIPIIALKGLVIRDLYPHPELRSMSDADILVHKGDIDKSEKVLVNLGYYKDSSIEIHSTFDHKKHLSIDLHWALVNELHIKTVSHFDKTLWTNTRTVAMNGLPILALSLEYELLHLILHMASHMIKSGFGLRQLCDVVLFIESKKDHIDWKIFFEKVKLYNIENLTITIFIVCKELFNMDLPKEQDIKYFNYNHHIEFLINEIFASGVFGKRDYIRSNSTKIMQENYNNDENSTNEINLMISFLFPSPKKLNVKYSYAKKYPFLIIFAWIHRIMYTLCFYGFSKFKQIGTLYTTAKIAKDRLKLLRWLQL